MPIIVNPSKFNINSLILDGAYLIIQPPPSFIQGVSSDVFGVVGTAAWGPVNKAVLVPGAQSIVPNFGPLVAASPTDPHDLVRDLILAFEQATGGGGLQGWAVRVTDGTDKAASVILNDTTTPTALQGGTFTALYTGGQGNSITVVFKTGGRTNTVNAMIAGWAGIQAEIYQNLPGDATFWPAFSQALASGISGIRGPSQLGTFALTYTAVTAEAQTVSPAPTGSTKGPFSGTLAHTPVKASSLSITEGSVTLTDNGRGALSASDGSTGTINYTTGAWTATYITAPASTATWSAAYSYQTAAKGPALGTFAPTGGADGRAAVTSNQLLGQNLTYPYTGAYALSSLRPAVGVFWIVGLTDSTIFTNLQALADNMAAVFLTEEPSATSTATAITDVQGYGIDDFEVANMKDWVYFNDSPNKQVYLTSPLPVLGGLLAALAPWLSPGNQPVFGIVGTERNNPFTGTIPYSDDELADLEAAGIIVITKPIPGGNVFGVRHGQNLSSNPATNGLAYSRMTNWLARSIFSLMGKYVGQPQTALAGDPLRAAVKHDLDTFMRQLKTERAGGVGAIQDFQNIVDTSINTSQTVAHGFLFFQSRVTYLGIVRWIVGYLQGGATVVTVGQAPLGAGSFGLAA